MRCNILCNPARILFCQELGHEACLQLNYNFHQIYWPIRTMEGVEMGPIYELEQENGEVLSSRVSKHSDGNRYSHRPDETVAQLPIAHQIPHKSFPNPS